MKIYKIPTVDSCSILVKWLIHQSQWNECSLKTQLSCTDFIKTWQVLEFFRFNNNYDSF